MDTFKNIEELENDKEIEKEVLFQNKHFNLKDFYLKNQEAALIMITPKQTICTYSIIYHEYVCKAICHLLYKDFNHFPYPNVIKSLNELINLQDIAKMYQIIIILLISNDNGLIFHPNKINEFQYEELCSLKAKFNEILPSIPTLARRFNVDKWGEIPFSEFVWYIKNRVDPMALGHDDERILGTQAKVKQKKKSL